MNYWIFVINEKNWKIVKKKNIIGSNYKNKIDLIKKDDQLVIYLIRPLSSFTGIYKVVTKLKDNSSIFSGGSYPYRLKLELVNIFKKPIRIKTIIDKLDFITNKKKWNTHFFGIRGIRKIAKKDFETISNIV